MTSKINAPHARSGAELVEDLRKLGVAAGDTLFIHASYKSLGLIDGGAATVVAALETSVAPSGLLLMPSFNLVKGDYDARAANWDVATTPSTVGWLSEYFRTMPGTLRSDHYSHAIAARGAGAATIVADHLSNVGMQSPWDRAPWGRTFGENSPLLRAFRAHNGKLLMLGVDYNSATYCHVVEVIDWNRRLVLDPTATYYWLDRLKAGQYWEALGRCSHGNVGAAECRLFAIDDFVVTLAKAVAAEPERFFKWYPVATPANSQASPTP